MFLGRKCQKLSKKKERRTRRERGKEEIGDGGGKERIARDKEERRD